MQQQHPTAACITWGMRRLLTMPTTLVAACGESFCFREPLPVAHLIPCAAPPLCTGVARAVRFHASHALLTDRGTRPARLPVHISALQSPIGARRSVSRGVDLAGPVWAMAGRVECLLRDAGGRHGLPVTIEQLLKDFVNRVEGDLPAAAQSKTLLLTDLAEAAYEQLLRARDGFWASLDAFCHAQAAAGTGGGGRSAAAADLPPLPVFSQVSAAAAAATAAEATAAAAEAKDDAADSSSSDEDAVELEMPLPGTREAPAASTLQAALWQLRIELPDGLCDHSMKLTTTLVAPKKEPHMLLVRA